MDTNKVWLYVALLAGAFALVVMARRPVQNLPASIAGPVAEAEQAWKQAAEAQDALATYKNENDQRFQELAQQQQALELELQQWRQNIPTGYQQWFSEL